ncbi:hypothetical protein P9B03_12000, partial [Metasolibacillus meyeri]
GLIGQPLFYLYSKVGDLVDERIRERVASTETELKDLKKRTERLEENNELLFRLTIVSEQQQEMNKMQQTQLDSTNETLNNINVNLTKLNMTQDELRKDVKAIGKRVDDVEKTLENGKLSFNEVIRKYLLWVIGLPMTVLGAYILFKLGL